MQTPRAPEPPREPRIGPNSVLQTLAALEELEGADLASAVRARCAPLVDPSAMIPEARFVEVVAATRALLPPPRAEAVLARAGDLTADYVAAHRIPAPIRGALRWLPPRLALPLLLEAFRRHAWTFAGGGVYEAAGPFPGTIALRDAPTCRGAVAEPVDRGAYYAAAFQGLLRLADPRVVVRETACQARGASGCRFSIELGSDPR